MNRLLEIAKTEAHRSSYGFKLGALVLKRGRIVAKGHNKTKTHPRLQKQGYYSIHAECDALMKAGGGDALIVVRVIKNGNYSCSKPCPKCLKFIKNYGIKKVIYSDWCGGIKEMKVSK